MKVVTVNTRKFARRLARFFAFSIAAGLSFMGAGNVLGVSALQSAALGATGAVIGLSVALLFTFAAKDGLSDADFTTAIKQAIEQVKSETTEQDDVEKAGTN